MSNPLQSLISNYLKTQNISRSEFAKLLGYTNTNKGLKRLDEFLITLHSPNNDIHNLILKNSEISESEFKVAYLAVLDGLDEQRAIEFTPMIRVTPKRRPSPLFLLSLYNIPVPANITNLDFDEELRIIRNLYKNHKIKFPTSTGFRYFRAYDCEILEFDSDGELINL